MINIDNNTIYDKVYGPLHDMYEQYITNKLVYPMLENNMCKLNTPLYYLSETFIHEIYRNNYKRALLFIGKCHISIPDNTKFLNTRDFNNGCISYCRDEFGRITYTTEKFDYEKLLKIAFSRSSLRLMCIKAEIAVFLFYYVLSLHVDDIQSHKFNRNKFDEPSLFILSAMAYCVNRYRSFNNSHKNITAMAVYIWELTTFINIFSDLTLSHEDNYNLPYRHLFQRPHRYCNIANFGDYDSSFSHENVNVDTENVVDPKYTKDDLKNVVEYIFDKYNTLNIDSSQKNSIKREFRGKFQNINVLNYMLNDIVSNYELLESNIEKIDEIDLKHINTYNADKDFYSHISRIPKCDTEINVNEDAWFYIPTESDTKELCTKCFNEIVENISSFNNDLHMISLELCKLCSYESSFQLNQYEVYVDGTEFYFNNDDEAKVFIDSIYVPENFDKSKLYYCFMIQDGDQTKPDKTQQKLKIFH